MPTNMTMNELVSPTVATSEMNQQTMQNAQKNAVGMTGAVQEYMSRQQDIQAKQQQQEAMNMQLQSAKYNTITGVTNSAMNMSDPIFNASESAMEKQLASVNPDYKKGTLKALRQDPDLKSGTMAYKQAVLTGEMPTDQAHKQMVIDAFGDPGKAETLINTFNEQRRLKSAESMKEATLEVSRENAKTAAGARVDAAGIMQGSRVQNIHNANVKEITRATDKQQQQLNNLQNSLSNISSGTAPTNESFSELQQSVRSNLGIKGTSGVGERATTYLKGIGMPVSELTQFLTMQPQDITKYGGTPFLEHIKALAANEVNNVRAQSQAKVNTLVASHKSFYDAHPDLKDDYNNFSYHWGKDVLGSNQAQGLPPAPGEQQAPQASAPQVQPKMSPAIQKTVQQLKAKYPNYTDQQLLDMVTPHAGGQ